jgi:hypothetical protein
MGRYLTQTTDRAEQLEEWVQKVAEATNRNLHGSGSELYDVELDIREPSKVSGKEYFNGFVGMRIRFIPKPEPEFLTDKDRNLWYPRIRELATSRFGIDSTIARNLDYANIEFKEPSEEELYVLTPNKKSAIEAGFERIRRFAEWYSFAVKAYGHVVHAHNDRMQKHLADLDTPSI